MGTPASGRGWVLTPFGVFALALPGFVMAFYLAPDLALQIPVAGPSLNIYITAFSGAAASWLTLAGIATLFEARPTKLLPLAATLAVTTYYWFTPVAVARAWALDGSWILALRALALALVGLWVFRALARGRQPSLIPVRFDT